MPAVPCVFHLRIVKGQPLQVIFGELAMSSLVERRKYKRFTAEDGTFVLFGSQPTVSGKMIDISENGVGFTYLASKCRTTKSIAFTLMSVLRSLNYRGIKGITVSDFRPADQSTEFERRCGIQFNALTEDQKGEIKAFIQSCTVSAA